MSDRQGEHPTYRWIAIRAGLFRRRKLGVGAPLAADGRVHATGTAGGTRRLAGSAYILLLPALLAGCGHAVGVLQPVSASVPGASSVDLLVVTNRKPSGDPGTLYGGQRDKSFALDDITVSIPPDAKRKAGEVQWPRSLPPDPAKDFVTTSVRQLPATQQAGTAWISRHLPKDGSVLLFVHGFNNSYEDSVYRFAQIVHDAHTDAAPVLFTWPSGARLLDYNYDRESTIFSRDALERAFGIIARQKKVGEISILAHSMGTWLTMEALRQMAIRNGRVAPKIRNVILASPDIDVDVFARQWADLGPHKPNVTIFVSRDDRALAVSRRIAGNVDRLGQINPNVEPYRSAVEKSGITVIDLTALKTGQGGMNHDKFAASPQIVRAIGTKLVEGQTLTESEVGLGDSITILAAGAAKAVGTGAGLVVSAPIAIVDPVTRRHLGGQAEELNKDLGATTGTPHSRTGEELLSGSSRSAPEKRPLQEQ